MPDVEDSSSPDQLVDPSQRCCNAFARMTTILHVVMVTILFTVIMFAYLFLYLSGDSIVASLVIQIIAYLALGCLYIYNSSCRQDKLSSAGYLVLVMSVFLFEFQESDTYFIEPISWANMVAISSYCVWRLSFILPYCRPRLRRLVRTILHGAIVAILLAVITPTYGLYRYYNHPDLDIYNSVKVWLLIQLVAYNAVAFLYICNSSGRKEKVVSGGLLVLVLFVILLSSFGNIAIRTDLIFGANIVAICSYCIWKRYAWIRRWFDALDAHTETEPRQPARQQEAVLQLQVQQLHIRDMPKEYSRSEIQSITQDFGSVIGQGGSAQVFRGSLDNGRVVAVKKIHMHTGRTEAGEEEFRREVSIIATVHHRSLVHLLGYCLQHGDSLYLVYPFFENGSLDRWLFDDTDERRRLLTWQTRFRIAVDVAWALAYLHRDCRRRILHLDIKPGNILLDGDLRAHVSDFGISLSITRGLTSVVDTRGRGTFGYMAPEMLRNAVSDKADVFSYGITLLELIGGRRNVDPNIERNLRETMAQGEHMELVDGAMTDVDEEAVKTALNVALCCIQQERDMRPSMQNVVDMLEGRVTVNLPPETRRPAVNLLEPPAISEHAVIDMHGG